MSTTQNKILDQCYISFLKYGLRSVSMDDIASSLGMSKKTIYQFFGKKSGLIKQTVKYFISKDEAEIKAITSISQNAVDEMVGIAEHVLLTLQKMSPSVVHDLKKYYPTIWGIVENKHFNFIFKVIRDNLLRGIEEGYYRKDLNADIVSRFYVTLSHTVTEQTAYFGDGLNGAEVFKELIQYHLNSILSEKGSKYYNKNNVLR